MRTLSWVLMLGVGAFAYHLYQPVAVNEVEAAVIGNVAPALAMPTEGGLHSEGAQEPAEPGALATTEPAAYIPAAAPRVPQVEAALKAGSIRNVIASLVTVSQRGIDQVAANAAKAELYRIEMEQAQEATEAGPNASRKRLVLTQAYLAATHPQRREGYRTQLVELAAVEVFSKRPSVDCLRHKVVPGDSLARISAQYKFPVEGLMVVNGLRRTLIRVGQWLKIPKGPVEMIVFKHDYRLVILADGRFIREYPVGIGRDDSTPEALFTIEEKMPKPTWYAPDGVYPFGHPKNILGTRWLGFNDTDDFAGFGLHGTSMPETIGTQASSGCIRLANADVEEVYAIVPQGASIRILP